MENALKIKVFIKSILFCIYLHNRSSDLYETCISSPLVIDLYINFHEDQCTQTHKRCKSKHPYYYDVEGKDKDENEDEESRAVLNKKTSTYACTQASSPMGKPALQRSYREDSTRMYSTARLTGQQ